jgi:hypothetical protein
MGLPLGGKVSPKAINKFPPYGVDDLSFPGILFICATLVPALSVNNLLENNWLHEEDVTLVVVSENVKIFIFHLIIPASTI